MENNIQNIELINSYLNKTLSEGESKNFENRLKTDQDFKAQYEKHVIVLEGIKRQNLKTEIRNAKQSYIRNKWLRYFGFGGIVIFLVSICFLVYNKPTGERDFIPNIKSVSTVNSDSILSKEPLRNLKVQDTLVTQKSHTKGSVNYKEIKTEKKQIKIPSFKKEPQAFTINSKKDTTLICKEGTKLIIKANSFIDTNNNTVKDLISLKVTEYYKLSDMLLANLTTQSDGKQLETGGMLFIETKKAKTNLKLKASSSVEIVFPTKNKKKEMQLFTGEQKNGILNWKLENNEIDDLLVDDVPIEIDEIEVPFAIIEQVPIYPGCEAGSNSEQRRCMSNAIEKLVKRKFNTEIAESIGLKGRQRINVIFKIDKYGDITNIKSRANHPKLEEEANRVIGLLPKMQPGIQRGKAVGVPYSLPIIFKIEKQTRGVIVARSNSSAGQTIRDSIHINDVERKLVSRDSASVTASQVNNYVLRTSKLGWINCDRFVRSSESIKYKLKIKNSEGAIVNMVFKSINSVMPSWKNNEVYDFRTVPKGKDVVLVAIKKHNNKLYLDVVETKTDVGPTIDFHFKEVTYKELKNKLRELNKLF